MIGKKERVKLLFLSTLSLRRATVPQQENGQAATISIHALLAESDGKRKKAPARALPFLSTLSLRRATKCSLGNPHKKPYFYPRSPCGERLLKSCRFFFMPEISIHALLAESDLVGDVWACRWPDISIHALLAESDIKGKPASPVISISIHALLAESDSQQRIK